MHFLARSWVMVHPSKTPLGLVITRPYSHTYLHFFESDRALITLKKLYVMAGDAALKLALKAEQSMRIVEQLGEIRLENQFNALRFFQDAEREELVRQISFKREDDKAFDQLQCDDYVHQIYYRLPDCGEAIACDDVAPLGCDDQTNAMPQFETCNVKPTKCIKSGFRIGVDQFQCEDKINPSQAFLVNMEREVKKLARLKQKELIMALAAEIGQNYAGTGGDLNAPLPLPLFTGATPSMPQPMALSTIWQEFGKQAPNGSDQPLFLTASGKLKSYMYANNVFRGNLDGFDPNRGAFSDSQFYIDDSVGQALSDAGATGTPNDLMIAVLPGTFATYTHLYHTNNYRKLMAGDSSFVSELKADGNVARFTRDYGSQFLGFPMWFDVLIKKEDCDRTVDVQIKQVYDFWCVPTDSFCPSTCTTNRTYNWKLLYEIICADLSCDDLDVNC